MPNEYLPFPLSPKFSMLCLSNSIDNDITLFIAFAPIILVKFIVMKFKSTLQRLRVLWELWTSWERCSTHNLIHYFINILHCNEYTVEWSSNWPRLILGTLPNEIQWLSISQEWGKYIVPVNENTYDFTGDYGSSWTGWMKLDYL